jgi:hypothetical protein
MVWEKHHQNSEGCGRDQGSEKYNKKRKKHGYG